MSFPTKLSPDGTCSMARTTKLSHMAVARIGRVFGLQPHRVENFKLSSDPFFVEKVRDIVGVAIEPLDHAAVLYVDEKSQIGVLDRTQLLLRLRPWQLERRTHDYKPDRITSLSAAF